MNHRLQLMRFNLHEMIGQIDISRGLCTETISNASNIAIFGINHHVFNIFDLLSIGILFECQYPYYHKFKRVQQKL